MELRIIIFLILTDVEFRELQNGSTKIIEKLYLTCKDRIYDFLVVKMNGNQEVAADILSETFTSVLTSVSRLKNNKNILGWLIGISYNIFRGHAKKHQYSKKIIEFVKDQKPLTSPDPLDQIDKKYKYTLIRTAMEQIKPDYKNILIMKHIKNQSLKEIAKTIQKSEKAVESLLHRAKKKLRMEINKLDRHDYY